MSELQPEPARIRQPASQTKCNGLGLLKMYPLACVLASCMLRC
ncbi:hypothetical protein SAMN05216466_12158 [Paraburkholderia phenazinium]|uniref:Uncharacterized protein n=1 Tax=Paraburkholderia phenazinium TaxID=60549 RepID=A0A1G8JUU8_9BURK|nr:hypothetical protein SAMN05216466_12158 [Paraburkholderia phenazinium]